MIVSNRKYPFGSIITMMRDGDLNFAISTAPEGLFKGLTTCVQIPVNNIVAKVWYMPSLGKKEIRAIHDSIVRETEEALKTRLPLLLIIDSALKAIKENGCALEIVTAESFKALVQNCKVKLSIDDDEEEEEGERVSYVCPHCSEHLRVILWKKNRCPKCKHIFKADA